MSSRFVGVATVREDTTQSIGRRAARDKFHVSIAGALLLIVAMGFARTLYLRALFDVPDIPRSLIFHGIVLTMWFGTFFIQTWLVAARRTDIHRRLGWALSVLALLAVAVSLFAMWNDVPRRIDAGAGVEQAIRSGARTLWPDIAALICFAVFLSAALANRRYPDTHKRLMLLAAISIVPPAMSRMLTLWRLPQATGVDSVVLALGGLFSLLVAMGWHDVARARRVHPITLIGGVVFLGSRIVSLFVIANSEVGQSFIRSLL